MWINPIGWGRVSYSRRIVGYSGLRNIGREATIRFFIRQNFAKQNLDGQEFSKLILFVK